MGRPAFGFFEVSGFAGRLALRFRGASGPVRSFDEEGAGFDEEVVGFEGRRDGLALA